MPKTIATEVIESKILFIRGHKVMLDRDLAVLYDVKAIRLREQVKRNIKRFPEDFMFRLSKTEINLLVSQNAIPSHKNLGGHGVMAFNEHGILMLSSILNSEKAIEVNIQIMRAFVRLRELMITHKDLAKKIEELETKFKTHDQNFIIVFEAIRQLIDPPVKPKPKIGFHT